MKLKNEYKRPVGPDGHIESRNMNTFIDSICPSGPTGRLYLFFNFI